MNFNTLNNETQALYAQIQLMTNDEVQHLLDELHAHGNDFTIVFNDSHVRLHFESVTLRYLRTYDDPRDIIMALFFGIEEREDELWTSQGITDLLQGKLTHTVEIGDKLEKSVMYVTDKFTTAAEQITTIFESFKQKLGDGIPSLLTSLMKHLAETLLVSLMDKKNFLKTFTKTLAAKILVYCMEMGVKYLDLFNHAKTLISGPRVVEFADASTWTSQGILDLDLENLELDKILSVKNLCLPFLFTFIIHSFYKIFTNGELGFSTLSSLWTKFKSLPREKKNIVNDIKDVLNFVGETFNLNLGKNSIKTRCKNLLTNITDMIKIKENLNGASRESDSISYVLENAQKAFALYEDYVSLVAECEKWGLKGEVKQLQAVKTQIEGLMKHYLAHAKYLQKDRKVPIFIILRGEPGAGKTQFLNLLSNFNSILHKPDMDAKSRITDLFTPALGSEYYDGYNPGTTTWIFDDLGTQADSAAKPDPTFANLINMVNNAPFSLNMSKAEEKGKIFFDSPFILASTNQQKWNIKSINNSDALARRTFLDIKVEVNLEFAEEYFDGNQTRLKVSAAKVDAKNLELGKPPGSYLDICSIFHVKKCGEKEATIMSKDEILELIAEEYYRIKHSVNMKESTNAALSGITDKLALLEAKYKMQGLEECEEEEYHDLVDEFVANIGVFDGRDTGFQQRFYDALTSISENACVTYIKDFDLKQTCTQIYSNLLITINNVKDAFTTMWENCTWKKSLIVAVPIIAIGLGYLAMNYFSKKIELRESTFGIYIVDDTEGWELLTRQEHANFADWSVKKRHQEGLKGKCYLISEPTWDAWTCNLIHTYIKYRNVYRLGIRRDDLHVLKEVKKVLNLFGEVKLETFDMREEGQTYNKDNHIPKLNLESQTYNKDNNIPKLNLESQTYNKDNTIPKLNLESRVYNTDNKIASVKMEGNSDLMPSLKKLFMQGHVDVTANALLTNRIPSNTGTIAVFESDGTRIGSMHITMIKGRIGVTASHLLLKGGDYIETRFINKLPQRYELSELILHTDTEKDLLFIEFPNRCEMYKDISKLFVEKSDFIHLASTRAAIFTYPDVKDTTRTCYKSGITHVVREDYTLATTNGETVVYRKLHALEYDIDTANGECGCVVVFTNNLLPRKLAGIHIAGQNASPSGMASIITQDYLRSILSKTNWRSQISYDLGKVYNFQSADVTELVKEAPCHGVSILGTVVDPPRVNTNSSITKGVLYGVFPPETKPCHLKNVNGIDILRHNSKKVSLATKVIESDLVQYALKDVSVLVNKGQDPKLVKVFDNDTAIQGIDDEKYVDGVKRQTSPGFPYVKAANGDGKRHWLGFEGEYIMDVDVTELVDIVVNKAKELERIPNIFVDSLKDERLPIDKVDSGKTRIFSCGDFIHTIAVRKYTLGFSAHLMRNKIMNESAVGIDVFTEWKKLAKFLTRDGKTKFVAGDFSGFDGTLNAQILWGIVDIIEDFYYNSTEEDRRVRYVLFADMINSIRLQNGVLYQCDHSQPSGNPLTVIINTLYNMIAIRIVYLLCKRQAGLPETLDDFRKYVNFVAYGDDNLYGIDDSIVSWFNQHTVTQAFDVIGMVYTDEAKTADGNIPAYRSFSDVGFLKRKFVLRRGLWMCPIAERTIRELCNWTKKSVDNLQASIDNIEDAFREAYYHGEEYYTEFTEHVNRAFKKYCSEKRLIASLRVKSYCELFNEHHEKNYPQATILI